MLYKKNWFLAFLFFWVFTGSFAFSATKEKKALFEKALTHFKNNKFSESSAIFLSLLKTQPESEALRFNLALSLYQKTGKKDPARAYLRQILFENPYHAQARELLKNLEDKKYFWLWIPEDFILALMALGLGGMIFAIFRKSLFLFRLGAGFFLILWGFSAYYFYPRITHYGSLKQDSSLLSGPDSSAPVLFEPKAGSLLKVLSPETPEGLIHVQIAKNKGWLQSEDFLPLNRKNSF